jgi:hypothetical protein
LTFEKVECDDAPLLIGSELDRLHCLDSTGGAHGIDDRLVPRSVYIHWHRWHGRGSAARGTAGLGGAAPANRQGGD